VNLETDLPGGRRIDPRELTRAATPGGVVLVLPPFAAASLPSIGLHTLQSAARASGHAVDVVYANLHLASRIGPERYRRICGASMGLLLGERLFARAAHGCPPLGNDRLRDARDGDVPEELGEEDLRELPFARAELEELERGIPAWIDELAEALVRSGPRAVGCSSSFEQTNASLALLAAVKRLRPEVVTLLGGSNCEGEMAEGLAELGPFVDHVFSGESEETFARFLDDLARGERGERVVRGEPRLDLDRLPAPDYGEYFAQAGACLGDAEGSAAAIPYETSRGCWWGQKHHCTFCGLNGETMRFRQKPAGRVLADLAELSGRHGTRRFVMVDNIMPMSYLRDLVPRLAEEDPRYEIFYEQKSNLGLRQLAALERAGIRSIQPGIEALSDAMLRRMDKGVTARQNLELLRNAASLGIDVRWNLLWGFPGDELDDYREVLAILPKLVHLQPPRGWIHLSIDRFSPYFERPQRYGIRGLRPRSAYAAVLPEGADVARCSYHFVGDYDCAAYAEPGLLRSIREAVELWRAAWSDPRSRPALKLARIEDHYVLTDTRGAAGTRRLELLSRDDALRVLSSGAWSDDPALHRAVERGQGLRLGAAYVSLVTAEPALLLELDAARG
jgi:ribosomal peptide maturation radical SAM protein 1